jgi:CubicO group peptidase (beta-lactamase class C family)
MLTPIKSPAFKNLDGFLQRLVDDNKVPGLIFLLYKHGKIEYLQKYGWQDIENKIPIEFDTIFRIYSMTKPIITIGLMKLFEEGKFKLNDPIAKFLPEFKDMRVFVREEDKEIITEELKRDITILDLFTHSSGLSYGSYEDDPIDKIYNERINHDILKSLSLEEVTKIFADIPLRFQPGKYFRYSYSIDVLGRLIEVFSEKSLDEYLIENVFQPLEMTNTSFYVPEDKLNRFAKIYLYSENNPLQLCEVPSVIERYSNKYKFLSGGGGLVSTLKDYFNFTLLFLNKGKFMDKQQFKPETMNLITKNYIKDNKTLADFALSKQIIDSLELHAYGHGLGIRVLIKEGITPTKIDEHGWGGLAYTYYWVDPQNEIIGLFMTQVLDPDASIIFSGIQLMELAYEGLE